jgi:Pretoxin HINT domain/HEAT repeats
MIATVLLVGGLIGASPEAPAKPDDLAAYQAVKAAAGRDAESQIKLALWCEAHGLQAERVKHLALAILVEPKNATARGLMGLVNYEGRWTSPDEVSRRVHEDPARAEVRQQYVERRAATPNKADAYWELALWCERNGLKAEATAHLRAVVRLDPGRESAWKRLGYRKERGHWVNEEQAAADRAEVEAQKAAEKQWKPLLEKSWSRLNDRAPARRAEARRALDAIQDPRAVPVVWSLFGRGDEARQREAVSILSRIDGPGASRALAVLAVFTRDPEVRRRAAETLPRRDPREFADLLVALLREPIKYDVKSVGESGSTGELLIKSKSATVKRLYTPPIFSSPSLPGDLLTFDAQGLPVIVRPWATLRGIAKVEQLVPIGRMALESHAATRTAATQLDGDVAAIERFNEPIFETNARVITLLTRITGRNHGDDHEAWRAWSTDLSGYAFFPQKASEEAPTFIEQVPIDFQPQAMPTFVVAMGGLEFGPLHQSRHHCFAAGTTVRTLNGPRPIEDVEAGDQVLVADPKTGALRFEAVVTAYHNPPNATIRVVLGDDAVVATGIHRFWKVGAGWVMARDLKAGDQVRTLGGSATVSAVEPDRTQPVFNLEVASGQGFFVGRAGALVHDNSLVVPVSKPFDAPLAGLAAKKDASAR